MSKIKSKESITWKYIPTTQNPTGLGSIACLEKNITESWFSEAFCLTKQDEWPDDTTTDPSGEYEH